MADNREEFSEKVLAKLKEKNRAVDLTEEQDQESPAAQEDVVQMQSEPLGDSPFEAFGTLPGSTPPTTGGNRDILIIPGFGGTSTETASQINFYWTAGYDTSAIPTNNTDTGKRTSIFNYADSTTAPALVFGGYNGTSYYGPTTTYGGVTSNGVVASIWMHPFEGQIDTNYISFTASA